MIDWHSDSIAAGRCNQDRLHVVEHASTVVAILADGAGGTGDGAAAAEAAVTFCATAARREPPASALECVELLRAADQLVLDNTAGGETTLIVAVVANGEVYGASVGNSIAWIVPDKDDPVDLTRHQRRRPFIGSGSATPVAFVPMRCSGSLVLASDGVCDYLPYAHFVADLRGHHPTEAVATVFASLRQRHRNLPDDASLLVLRTRAQSR
jgi:serine/threonine protein phosphatase PrpC